MALERPKAEENDKGELRESHLTQNEWYIQEEDPTKSPQQTEMMKLNQTAVKRRLM